MKKFISFGPLFVILAALLWSFDGVLRISLYSLPPTVIVFWEHTLGALILLTFYAKWIKDIKKMGKKEWLAISIVSVFSGTLGTVFYTAALSKINYSSYSVVVLLQQQLQPIWAIATAAILLKEKITKRFLIWAGIALFSAFLITFKDLKINFDTGNQTATAGFFALTAGLLWGSSTAISKYALNKISFLTATALRFLMAPLFALLLITGQNKIPQLTILTTQQWFTLILITFSTGLVALSLYYYGLKKTPARITTLCELVWPASAIFIDYFLYKKTLSPTQLIGVVLLGIAIYQVTQPLKKRSEELAEEFPYY